MGGNHCHSSLSDGKIKCGIHYQTTCTSITHTGLHDKRHWANNERYHDVYHGLEGYQNTECVTISRRVATHGETRQKTMDLTAVLYKIENVRVAYSV